MRTDGNILVLTHWSFNDALVQTYTLPYVEIIRAIASAERKIIIVTAEQHPIALRKDETDQINREWQSKNMRLVPESYRKFGLKKLFNAAGNIYKLYRMVKKEKINTIHAFCTPAGGVAFLLSKLAGIDLIIDSYEPHAEAMVENGTWKEKGMAYKILAFLEKKQTQYAKALIATTAGMKDYAFNRYGVKVKNFFVKPACVDLEKFYPREKDPELVKELKLENKTVCVYAGKLGGIYYNEQIFDFIRACYDRWGEDFRFVMLTNSPKEEIERQIRRVGLPSDAVVSRFVYHNDIPRYLSLGDFAINPVKPVPTKRFCTSIKDGEYWASGLPVAISPNISDDSEIIAKERIGVIMNFDNKSEFEKTLNRIEELMRNSELKSNIRKVGERYRAFTIAENIYKIIYHDKAG